MEEFHQDGCDDNKHKTKFWLTNGNMFRYLKVRIMSVVTQCKSFSLNFLFFILLYIFLSSLWSLVNNPMIHYCKRYNF